MAMTEQDLLTAMAATGRSVSSRTIKEWRQTGLLPNLASQSRGLRKGKICFWPDDTTFDRAALIFDLFRDQVAKHDVYWLLFLCGMSVPPAQLRRAWAQKANDGRHWKMDGAGARTLKATESRMRAARGRRGHSSGSNLSDLVLSAALTACASLSQDDEPEIDALVEALDASFGSRVCGRWLNHGESPGHAITVLKAVWSSIRSSDLMRISTDAELRDAQQYVSVSLRILQRGIREHREIYRARDNTASWPVWEAQTYGAPLFMFALLMVRSGQRALLDSALAEVKYAPGRNVQRDGSGVATPPQPSMSRLLVLT